MCIPSKTNKTLEYGFSFYLMKDEIIFIDDEEMVSKVIEKTHFQKPKKTFSVERFLYEILTEIVEEDFLFLEKLETEISDIEEQVLKKSTENFNYKMIQINKNISRFYKYYSQLINIGEIMIENNAGSFFRLYTEKMRRLKDEAQILREYNMQVLPSLYSKRLGMLSAFFFRPTPFSHLFPVMSLLPSANLLMVSRQLFSHLLQRVVDVSTSKLSSSSLFSRLDSPPL